MVRRRLRRFLRSKAPILSRLVLWLRRVRGVGLVRDVLQTEQELKRATRAATVALSSGGDLEKFALENVQILPQPPQVIDGQGRLFWPLSPQLQRTPYTAEVIWRHERRPEILRGRTFLAAVDGFSYYHWLLGTLPLLLAARKSQTQYDYYLVNPRQKGADNFQAQTFRLLNLPSERVRWLERGRSYRCETLEAFLPPASENQTELRPWAREILRTDFVASLASSITSAAALPARFYIRRHLAKRRRLVNEEALLNSLQSMGIESVVLDEIPLADQVRLFQGAELVVGLHGAGLANLVFSRPGTRVLEIMPKSWQNPCFFNLSRSGGLHYAQVVAPSVFGESRRHAFQADACVDIDSLVARLKEMLAER